MSAKGLRNAFLLLILIYIFIDASKTSQVIFLTTKQQTISNTINTHILSTDLIAKNISRKIPSSVSGYRKDFSLRFRLAKKPPIGKVLFITVPAL
jgi:hypothetical protein